MQLVYTFKGYIFPPTCSATYPSTLLWCELSSFGHISCRDFCLLSNIKRLNDALNVVLIAPNIHLRNSPVMSLSRNQDNNCEQIHIG